MDGASVPERTSWSGLSARTTRRYKKKSRLHIALTSAHVSRPQKKLWGSWRSLGHQASESGVRCILDGDWIGTFPGRLYGKEKRAKPKDDRFRGVSDLVQMKARGYLKLIELENNTYWPQVLKHCKSSLTHSCQDMFVVFIGFMVFNMKRWQLKCRRQEIKSQDVQEVGQV